MSLADTLVPEWRHEMAGARAVLAAVPGARANWKPHQKSMTMGELATHIAVLPRWGLGVLRLTELDLGSGAAAAYQKPAFESGAALAAGFQRDGEALAEALAAADDRALATPWTLRSGPHVIFTQPRSVALRGFVFSHLIHHRAQMTVYLRLCDLPVPPIYGPSADSAPARP